MRAPTRSRAIARPCAAWAVPPWPWRCAAMRPRRKSSPRGLRSFFQTEPSGMPCSYPRFARRSPSTATNRRRAWNCWHPPRHTSALTLMRFICAAWLTCACIRARRQRLSSRKSWITRAPIGALPGSTPIGDSSIRSPIWSGDGARLRARGRQGESQKCVPGLLRIVEGRRLRHPDSSARQSGIRRAAVREAYDHRETIHLGEKRAKRGSARLRDWSSLTLQCLPVRGHLSTEWAGTGPIVTTGSISFTLKRDNKGI